MDMDQAAVFLAASILFALGALVVLGAVLIANNLIAKYWKSWGWTWMSSFYPDRPPTRFMTPEEAERIAPHLEDPVSGEKHKTK